MIEIYTTYLLISVELDRSQKLRLPELSLILELYLILLKHCRNYVNEEED